MHKVPLDKQLSLVPDCGIHNGMLSWGFSSLNKIVGHFSAGDLIVLGGRPGNGKSLLSLTLSWHLAFARDKSVLFGLSETDVKNFQ